MRERRMYMKYSFTKLLFFCSLTSVLVFSCVSTVERIDEDTRVDLSGRWNDTDSRLVAQEMTDDSLARVWLEDFIDANGKKPAVIVGSIRNMSHEHISTEAFIKDIEREYVNSGRVRVIQAGAARDEIRKERTDQQQFASPETVRKWGRELGADFILQGVLNSIVDADSREKLVFYQVDLELTDIETNEKVWIGTKKIKKIIKK